MSIKKGNDTKTRVPSIIFLSATISFLETFIKLARMAGNHISVIRHKRMDSFRTNIQIVDVSDVSALVKIEKGSRI